MVGHLLLPLPVDWLAASFSSVLPPCILIEEHIARLAWLRSKSNILNLGCTECRLLVYHQKVSKSEVEAHLSSWSPETLLGLTLSMGLGYGRSSWPVSLWMWSFLTYAYLFFFQLSAPSIPCSQFRLHQVLSRNEIDDIYQRGQSRLFSQSSRLFSTYWNSKVVGQYPQVKWGWLPA